MRAGAAPGGTEGTVTQRTGEIQRAARRRPAALKTALFPYAIPHNSPGGYLLTHTTLVVVTTSGVKGGSLEKSLKSLSKFQSRFGAV